MRKLFSWWPGNMIETSVAGLILFGLISILTPSLIRVRELKGAPAGSLPVVQWIAIVLAAICFLFLVGVVLYGICKDWRNPRGCEIVEVPAERPASQPQPENGAG